MTCFVYRAAALVLAVFPAISFSDELPRPVPLGEPATTVYRQVLPDGRIVYSDKPVKGARVDETINADRETNTWTSESGKRPVVPPKVERTPVNKVPSPPQSGKTRTGEDRETGVIRAEMLLEDAKKRQQQGVEPLPGERTGNVSGGSRLNEKYWERQRSLAEEAAEAEALLKKSIEERDAIRVSPTQR